MIRTKNKLFLLAGGLVATLALSTLLLTAPHSYAALSDTANLTLNVPSSCSLEVASPNLSATINPGASATIGSTNVKAICNDPDGLAVYSAGFTGDSYGNNDLTATINGTIFNIDSAVASNPTASQWNMTLAAVSGTYAPIIMNQTTGDNPVGDFTQPHVVPEQYTKVAYRNSYTDAGNNATGANFTATFNVYVAGSQPAGTYTGKVKFLLVHPNVLTYDAGQPATFAPNTLARDPEVPLLQDVATWGSSVALGSSVEAVDSRDGQIYKVSRFKMSASDTVGKLWMSNLNLGAVSLASGVTQLDNTNTNLPNDSSKFISASDFMAWDRTTSGTAMSYTDPKFTPVTASNASNGLAADTYGNKYGTLYNFAAASANTINTSSNSNDATSDLCPAGWRLPTGNTTGEFQALYNANSITDNAAGVTKLQQDFGFPLAGYFGSSTPSNQGFNATYWSSTRRDGYGVYDLYFSLSRVYPAQYDERNLGNSVRCVAQ